MMLTRFMLNWRELADFPKLAAALNSATLAAGLGVHAARRLSLPAFRWPAALIGAGTTIFSLMPFMLVCGSLGAGLYALPAIWLPIENIVVGKTFVVIATALGCAFVAWLLCLFLLGAPAVVVAVRRRTGSVG